MYDSGKIITGLIIFIGLFATPIWYNAFNRKAALNKPELILSIKGNQKECVGSIEFIRSYHMVMLNDWRYKVVRMGERNFVSNNNKKFEMSLTKTCLNCHTSRSQFCDQCHNYIGVSPNCWNCHTEPKKPGSKR